MSKRSLVKIFPIIEWASTYRKKYLLGDLSAGIAVGILIIPQGMAYATIAGLPPVYGLYAAFVPQLIYAILGTSRQLSIGPVAIDSLIVSLGLSAIAISDVQHYIAMAVFLALFTGVIQFFFGCIKLGFLVNYLSKPVISGFITAVALIIGLSQLKHILGIKIANSNKVHTLITALIEQITQINYPTLGIGLGSIVLILLLKKRYRAVPYSLVVISLSILFIYCTQWHQLGVDIVKQVPSGLPKLQLPNIALDQISALFGTALTLALIGYTEVISIVKSIEEKHNYYEVDANKEWIALGSANIMGAFFQAYSISGSFSRSAIQHESGGKTGLSFIFAAILVGITLLFLTPLFYYLPYAVLGAIILVAVFGLIDFKYPIALYKSQKEEFFLYLLTFILTILIGIKEGILSGIIGSLLLLVYRTSKPHIAVLGKVKGTEIYRNIKRFHENIEIRNDLLIIRFDAPLFFGNKDYFKQQLRQKIKQKGTNLKYIIINAESISYIDSSAKIMLEKLWQDLKNKGYLLAITNVIGPTRDIIFKSNLVKILGIDNTFVSVAEAVHYFDTNKKSNPVCKSIATQSK